MLSIQSANSVDNSAVLEKKPAELKNKSPNMFHYNDPVTPREYVTISLREVVPQLSEQGYLNNVRGSQYWCWFNNCL